MTCVGFAVAMGCHVWTALETSPLRRKWINAVSAVARTAVLVVITYQTAVRSAIGAVCVAAPTSVLAVMTCPTVA